MKEIQYQWTSWADRKDKYCAISTGLARSHPNETASTSTEARRDMMHDHTPITCHLYYNISIGTITEEA